MSSVWRQSHGNDLAVLMTPYDSINVTGMGVLSRKLPDAGVSIMLDSPVEAKTMLRFKQDSNSSRFIDARLMVAL